MAAFIFLQAMSPGRAAAMSMMTYDYDLDSLVYLSSGIVEGRLVGPSRLRITAVHAGSLRLGDTVSMDGGDEYRRSVMPIFASGTPLAAGDGVFVFYDQPRLVAAINAGEQVSHITPIHGGIKLVMRGRVHGCSQSNNPGPFYVTAGFATVAEYRAAIKASMAKVAAWRTRLGKAAGVKDMLWLIALLKDRYTPPLFGDWDGSDGDIIVNLAADRLLEIHDLNALDQGLLANPSAFMLLRGFNTADGREFLLRKIAEESAPKAHRLQLARALGGFWTEGMYVSSTRPGRLPDTEDPRTFSYLTRIAELAASESARDDELAGALLDALKYRVGYGQNDRDSRLQADEDDAVGVLRKIYEQKTTSGGIRFRIEEVLAQIDYAKYQSLGSKCGPILTLAEPADTSMYATPAVPSLILQYTFRGIRGSTINAAVLVLESASGGVTYAVPSAMIAVGHSSPGAQGGGGDIIPLPAGIAPGRYRVFYRLMNGSKVVSEGHGYETDIPVPASVSGQMNAAKRAWFAAQMTPRPPVQLRKSWINSAAGVLITIIAALILQAFARGRRGRWRMRRGLCPDCGYDLRASTVQCPECGRPVSGDLGLGVVRRRLRGMVRAGSIIVAVAVIGLWVRSYWAADCLTRTAGRAADTLYSTRGAIVFEHSNADDDYGWTYEHDSPAAFPRSVSETVGSGWRVLGLEYSPDANLAVVPCWVVVMTAALLAVLFTRTGKRDRRTLSRSSDFR